MNQNIVEHLFAFWAEIGDRGGFLNAEKEYSYTTPNQESWPSKVFGLKGTGFNIDLLKDQIEMGVVPNSVSIYEDKEIAKHLLDQGFTLASTIKAMAMDISNHTGIEIDPMKIEQVDSDEKSRIFANVASESFGYPVLKTTISPLFKSQSFKLFLGKHGDAYGSCGMVYLDKNQIAGIHMIGTLSQFRGRGLGKLMTQHLIHEAQKNGSQQIYLVASEAGERIYQKMGFKNHGTLQSYSL
ncbi:GNAT family N-acetyltransferase [Allomuricauda sp. CP2A]|jgi:GNAT superfamily N-acetyltransferase|uniref:GNAT family N-acetyltransferase n=1 Tax=Allomuricauda sp. CP2A TaxID=1848189 RepID=UPI000836C69A|nr:GNAT family N-acetyltransferase [Muricauda sp. CP2A]